MFEEMLAVSNAVKPDNVVFVMDASIGQVSPPPHPPHFTRLLQSLVEPVLVVLVLSSKSRTVY